MGSHAFDDAHAAFPPSLCAFSPLEVCWDGPPAFHFQFRFASGMHAAIPFPPPVLLRAVTHNDYATDTKRITTQP